ncbi:unnamed protein product [Rhizoctonia solani]|uniref:Suppressor of white apricot N-terminal domain-containing protein n=1 Tax=Rhizoctonia solani TaxID=456999 RepID=A0A8H2WEA6_9AGAM|nr:unnamed protein product [Rhizoctonia solani]
MLKITGDINDKKNYRFDIRLLLESPEKAAIEDKPNASPHTRNDSLANVGWDDLPSDSEDTFFLTPKEVNEYRHDKRRKMLEKGRQDRLRALAEEDEANGWGAEPPEALWGGSDEEPDDVQANLMHRTATHIRASPNPTQLEMRILANHGADPRFAFLRGRWKRAWARMRQGQESSTNAEPKQSIIGGLSAYASDSDSGQKSGDEAESGQQSAHAVQEANLSSEHDETEKLKAERRARAKDWARKRREAQITQGGNPAPK